VTKGIYIIGAILVALSLVLFFTGRGLLAFPALGGASACLSVTLFINPAIIAKNIRFENPAAKRATTYFIAALFGLVALMLAMAVFMLSRSRQ